MTYNEFIQNIIDTRGQWNIPEGEYFEVHHIIPKCMGGEGKIRKGRKIQTHPNLIYLYPEEHFIAHKLLAIEDPTNKSIVNAWNMMAYPKGKTKREYEISPEDYKLLREMWSNCMKENNNFLDENGHPVNYGKPMSEDQKIKLSKAKLGKKLGPDSEETKRRKSEAQKKRFEDHPETYVGGNKDLICITDGNTSYYINKDQKVPDGFHYGMARHKKREIKDIDSYKEQKRLQNLGKHWYNNGEISVFSFDCPDGYVKGRIYKREKK